MEQIEEILSCEENSAGIRLKELVEALELKSKSKLVKGNKYLTYESKIQKFMHTKTVVLLRCINFYKISRWK